jgi:hypothetical protein
MVSPRPLVVALPYKAISEEIRAPSDDHVLLPLCSRT